MKRLFPGLSSMFMRGFASFTVISGYCGKGRTLLATPPISKPDHRGPVFDDALVECALIFALRKGDGNTLHPEGLEDGAEQ